MAGVSNATVDQIREAHDVLGRRLVSVQNQFSPAFRSSEAELAAREVPGGRPDPGVEPPGDRTLLRSGGNAHAEPRTR